MFLVNHRRVFSGRLLHDFPPSPDTWTCPNDVFTRAERFDLKKPLVIGRGSPDWASNAAASVTVGGPKGCEPHPCNRQTAVSVQKLPGDPARAVQPQFNFDARPFLGERHFSCSTPRGDNVAFLLHSDIIIPGFFHRESKPSSRVGLRSRDGRLRCYVQPQFVLGEVDQRDRGTGYG